MKCSSDSFNWKLTFKCTLYRCKYFQLLSLSTLSSFHRVLTFDCQFVVISTECLSFRRKRKLCSLFIISLFSRMVSLYLKRCPVSFEEEILASCLSCFDFPSPFTFFLLSILLNLSFPDLFFPIFFSLTLDRLKPKGTLWRDHQMNSLENRALSLCLFCGNDLYLFYEEEENNNLLYKLWILNSPEIIRDWKYNPWHD